MTWLCSGYSEIAFWKPTIWLLSAEHAGCLHLFSGLSEQEAHINFCTDEKTAALCTSYPTWIRKMEKLVEKNPQSFQCVAENSISKTCTMPRNFISIQSKERTITINEEQKEQAARRLQDRK